MHSRLTRSALAFSVLLSLSGCASSEQNTEQTCEAINLANDQITLILSNPGSSVDAWRTKLKGIDPILAELSMAKATDPELAKALGQYVDALDILMNGVNSALDGKRTIKSLEPNAADYQIAAAELLPFCELR